MPDPLVARVPDAPGPAHATQVGKDVEPDDHDGIGPELAGEPGDGRDPAGRDTPVRPEPFGQARERRGGLVPIVRAESAVQLQGQARDGLGRRFRHGGHAQRMTLLGEGLHQVVAMHVVAAGARPGQPRLDEQEPHRPDPQPLADLNEVPG